MTERRNAGNTWSSVATQEHHRRYMCLMASLHSLSVEMEERMFPVAHEKVWKQRSGAIDEAVQILIAGQHLKPKSKAEDYE